MAEIRRPLAARYGWLTVLREIPGSPARVLCCCACGTETTPYRRSLLAGTSTSCGCKRVRTHHRLRSVFRRTGSPTGLLDEDWERL